MQYRTLGRTGVQVSSLALGTMNFGAIGSTTQEEVTAIVDAALEGGINLVDTADVYSRGESENWSAQPSPAAATTSCSPRRRACPWARTATAGARRAAG